MGLFAVSLATLLMVYIVIRSACRLWKRCRDGVNVNEDPEVYRSALVDTVLLVLGFLYTLMLIAFLLRK